MNCTIEQLPKRIADKLLPVTESGCWLWMGNTSTSGYGRVFWNGRMEAIHRVVYTEIVGAIPDGLTIDHLCKVVCCANPNHLEAVSMRENILRGESGSARNARKTACRYGHPYSEDNTYFTPNEHWRRCIACQRKHAIARTVRRQSPHLCLYIKQCKVCAGFLPKNYAESGCPKCGKAEPPPKGE